MEQSKLNSFRKSLLSIYLIVIVLIGVIFVPTEVGWGVNNVTENVKYVPIWMLHNSRQMIFRPCIDKLVYEIAITTLVFVVIYFIYREDLALKHSNIGNKEEIVNQNN